MTAMKLVPQLYPFIGRQLIECADEILAIGKNAGYVINVIDPVFNESPIDYETNRLNVWTDKDSIIISFSIG